MPKLDYENKGYRYVVIRDCDTVNKKNGEFARIAKFKVTIIEGLLYLAQEQSKKSIKKLKCCSKFSFRHS